MNARITIASFAFAVFAMNSCNSSKTTEPIGGVTASPTVSAEAAQTPPATTSIAKISATPNPVPAGSVNGTTTIKWTTGDGTTGHVYVSSDGGSEQIFSTAPAGSADAPWILAGKTYEFRLYNSDHTKLLGKVVVTRAGQ